MSARSRVVPVLIADRLRLYADTGGTRVFDVSAPEISGLLPHAESLQLQWLLEGVANNEIDWNIDAFTGWDRNHELPPASFFASPGMTTPGPGLATITNFTASNYFRHCRLQVKWALHSGVTTAKEGIYSAILFATLKGG